MDKSRKQFEDEYGKHSTLDEVDIFKIDSESDDYYYLATRWAWRWWQASRESLEVELPNKEPSGDDATFEEGLRDGYNNAIDDFKQILISNGVKIKDE
ncbi:hypothetical protein ACJZSO_002841 [Proteus mirabilis]|uniref:hypothetical protein n=1 Tax=Proteus mirabilis TaxID=584 RepID=UPI001624898E|nr:hypothetical protein [Proteus mirabilis]MBB6652075.1 hypothetical protein [Proteus mirabilis]HEJ9518021.1 hypothetical protein [Proteus mirabilis]HEJ9554139.1 hypothetical protein [Proteus mirabilis]